MKFETLLIWSILFLQITLLGTIFNFAVVSSNHGLMPVKADWSYSDDSHFTYQDNSEVNHWYFSDIIPNAFGICSIGDILIWLGLAGYCVFYGLFIYQKFDAPKKKEGIGEG